MFCFNCNQESLNNIECSEKCIFCVECAKEMFSCVPDKKNIEYWEKNKCHKCFYCDLGSFCEDDMFNSLCLKEYVIRTRKLESDISIKNVNDSVKDALHNKISKKDVPIIMNDIRESLSLSLSCPHCASVFVDFTGCMALTCSNPICEQNFCGICFNKKEDAHSCVLKHNNYFSKEDKQKYSFSDYYMSESGSKLWFEKVKMNSIYLLLTESYNKIAVLPILKILIEEIKKEKLMEDFMTNELVRAMHSNNTNGHMIRLPTLFWTVISSKHNITLENAMENYKLDSNKKMDLGRVVVREIKKKFPYWETQVIKVPGETFNAINYPNEFLPYIRKIIEEWILDNPIYSNF